MVGQASLTCCLFFFHDFRILCIDCDLRYGISSTAPKSWPDQECFCGLTLPGFFTVPIASIFLWLPSLFHPLYLKSMSPPTSVYFEPIDVRLCYSHYPSLLPQDTIIVSAAHHTPFLHHRPKRLHLLARMSQTCDCDDCVLSEVVFLDIHKLLCRTKLRQVMVSNTIERKLLFKAPRQSRRP